MLRLYFRYEYFIHTWIINKVSLFIGWPSYLSYLFLCFSNWTYFIRGFMLLFFFFFFFFSAAEVSSLEMNCYEIRIWVTLEQETAIVELFKHKRWIYSRIGERNLLEKCQKRMRKEIDLERHRRWGWNNLYVSDIKHLFAHYFLCQE